MTFKKKDTTAAVPCFDETTLMAEIVATWGEYGAHADVYATVLAEIKRLQRWKTDATYVLDAWEKAWNLAAVSDNLGATKSEAMLDEIIRLRAEVQRKHDYGCRMDALAEERLMEITRLRANLSACEVENDELHDDCNRLLVELGAERALANQLADALGDHMRGEDHPAYTAWEEARREQ